MIRDFVTLFLFFLLLSTPSFADGIFFQWTDADGVVNVTDDAERIPPRFLDRAVERRFEDIQARRTPVTITAADYQASLEASIARNENLRSRTLTMNPNRNINCSGTLTIDHERRDYEERGQRLNSMFYVIRNACGEEISATREQPSVQVELER